MIKLSSQILEDEEAMRTVYTALGLSPRTTEAAIQLRRIKPVNAAKPPSPLKGRKNKPAVRRG
jgi:hypothetical protein